jgi:hypothetical protein
MVATSASVSVRSRPLLRASPNSCSARTRIGVAGWLNSANSSRRLAFCSDSSWSRMAVMSKRRCSGPSPLCSLKKALTATSRFPSMAVKPARSALISAMRSQLSSRRKSSGGALLSPFGPRPKAASASRAR